MAEENHKKRKSHDGPELEIDVSAPEPPSKKALRKAKKEKIAGDEAPEGPEKENKVNAVANKQSAPPAEKRSAYGIWIGNLPFSTNKDDLRRFFTSNCSFTDATVTRIHMPKSPGKNGQPQNKGFAYVDFTTDKAAKQARELSDHLLSGRPVLIKDAKDFKGRPEKSQQEKQTTESSSAASGHPPSRRIFIGNLGFDVTKDDLEEHLGKCGTVARSHIATFQDSGKCRGYAWVEFEDKAAAEAAVRGFVMVDKDDDEVDEGSEEDVSEDEDEPPSTKRKPTRKAKKSRQKKLWVNRLMGRQMRMEFAEDPTTRYKKRFGKESSKTNPPAITEVTEDGDDGALLDGKDEDQKQVTGKKSKKDKRDTPNNSRYDQATVQKLSGAIVQSQGKKITFD